MVGTVYQLLKDALLLKKELTPVNYLYPIEKQKQLETRLDRLPDSNASERKTLTLSLSSVQSLTSSSKTGKTLLMGWRLW
jgi:hypothetical protein